IVSGQGRGTGPVPQVAVAFAINAAGTEAYVAEPTAVFGYDLETGDRTEIFSTDQSDIYIADIAYDAVSERLLAVGSHWEMRVIDPATGKTEVLSDEPEDCMTTFNPPRPVTAMRDPAGEWIVGTNYGQIVIVDDAGACTLIHGDPDEIGASIGNLLLDGESGTYYFTQNGAVFSMSAGGLDVTEKFSPSNAHVMALAPDSTRLSFQDAAGVVAHDPASSETAYVAKDEDVQAGSGPLVDGMIDAAFDVGEGRAYVINYQGELFTIDMATGERAAFLEEPV